MRFTYLSLNYFVKDLLKKTFTCVNSAIQNGNNNSNNSPPRKSKKKKTSVRMLKKNTSPSRSGSLIQ